MSNVVQMNVMTVGAHPDLDGFPMITADQMRALKASIVEHGVMEPIKVVEATGSAACDDGFLWWVVNGRNRVLACRELGIELVPAIVLDRSVIPLTVALEDAVTGRQLSKTAIALMLLEHHPNLKGERKTRRQENLRVGDSRIASGNSGKFKEFSIRYSIQPDYFTRLCDAMEMCRNPFDMARLRVMVYEKEVSAKNICNSMAGWIAEHPIDQKISEAELRDVPVPMKAPINLSRGFLQRFIYMQNQFKSWEKLSVPDRPVLRDEWGKVLAALPRELRDYTSTYFGAKQ